MGKPHYKWPFSIAMLNYQRVIKVHPTLIQSVFWLEASRVRCAAGSQRQRWLCWMLNRWTFCWPFWMDSKEIGYREIQLSNGGSPKWGYPESPGVSIRICPKIMGSKTHQIRQVFWKEFSRFWFLTMGTPGWCLGSLHSSSWMRKMSWRTIAKF